MLSPLDYGTKLLTGLSNLYFFLLRSGGLPHLPWSTAPGLVAGIKSRTPSTTFRPLPDSHDQVLSFSSQGPCSAPSPPSPESSFSPCPSPPSGLDWNVTLTSLPELLLIASPAAWVVLRASPFSSALTVSQRYDFFSCL